MRSVKILMGFNLAMLLLLLAAVGLQVAQAQPQTAVYFDNAGDRMVVADGGEIMMQPGAIMTTDGSWLLAQQSEAITGGFSITPESPYIVLTSSVVATSSTSTPVVTTTATAGQIIILRNGNASNAITIDGVGGTVECKANVALGASDTLTLIFNGSDWNCLAGYDNS